MNYSFGNGAVNLSLLSWHCNALSWRITPSIPHIHESFRTEFCLAK